jgi:hypothetical protein
LASKADSFTNYTPLQKLCQSVIGLHDSTRRTVSARIFFVTSVINPAVVAIFSTVDESIETRSANVRIVFKTSNARQETVGHACKIRS